MVGVVLLAIVQWRLEFFAAPGYVSRLFSIEEITDERESLHGVKQLEHRLSDCRPKTRILLAGPDRVAPGKAAGAWVSPGQHLNELIRYPKTRNIQIDDPRRSSERHWAGLAGPVVLRMLRKQGLALWQTPPPWATIRVRCHGDAK